jgi:hypothetical protein
MATFISVGLATLTGALAYDCGNTAGVACGVEVLMDSFFATGHNYARTVMSAPRGASLPSALIQEGGPVQVEGDGIGGGGVG